MGKQQDCRYNEYIGCNDQFATFRGGKRLRKARKVGKSRMGGATGMSKNTEHVFGKVYPKQERVFTCKLQPSPEKLGADVPFKPLPDGKTDLLYGGGKGEQNPLLEASPHGDGLSSYGYTDDQGHTYGSYAPITKHTRKVCRGGKKNKRKTKRKVNKRKTNKRKTNKRKTKRRVNKRKSNKRKSHKRRGGRHHGQKGGNKWLTNWGDVPNTPGEAIPKTVSKTLSALANPPTFNVINRLGTGNCVDNYNHYTGKSFRTPIFDKAAPQK